jgi:carbamoyltransferase
MLVAAMRVGVRDGAAALGEGGALTGVCAQERVLRIRGGPTPDGVPDKALDLLLRRAGRTRGDIQRLEVIGGRPSLENVDAEIGDHFGHACTAYLTSRFDDAAVVVCDRDWPGVSVWRGQGRAVTRCDIPWEGPGFAELYSRFARAIGFAGDAAEQLFEGLARLAPLAPNPAVGALVSLDGNALVIEPSLERLVEERLPAGVAADDPRRAALAAALQARLGDLLIEFLGRVRSAVGVDALCAGGSLFYHTALNTRLRAGSPFREVFVPVDPGDAGLPAGAVVRAMETPPTPASPFLGPSYAPEETKEVLDNCKLQYSWETDGDCVSIAVEALSRGRLVGWFDGAMEWGPRALGARSILANPAAPYVLENLNRFLKHRDRWRGYALSGLETAVPNHFEGPAASPFMECDYRPRHPETFRHLLPSPGAVVRVHTVGEGALPRFVRLLEATNAATGLPFLVNTSFNGFHEPSVCSPRDAVRVFFGSGLDLLVVNNFVLRK